MEKNEESIINWYECPICNYMSRNKEKIEKCMAQGRKKIYQIGQTIEFYFIGSNSYDLKKVWFKGEIKKISFSKRTHRAYYTLLLNDSELPPQLFGREMKIHESRIRSSGEVNPAKTTKLDK